MVISLLFFIDYFSINIKVTIKEPLNYQGPIQADNELFHFKASVFLKPEDFNFATK